MKAISLVLVSLSALPDVAAIPGFVQDFSGSSLGGFGGGATVSNPGTGGVGGAGDGYLTISRSTPGNFASPTSAPEIVGNLPADGVTGYRIWLNDVGADQAFEIHVALGIGGTNFWVYNPGFTPLENAWSSFDIDITNSANWTQIIGTGSFAAAMQGSTVFQIRHQIPPFAQNAGSLAGELGVDRITVLPVPEPSTFLVLAPLLLLASQLRRNR